MSRPSDPTPAYWRSLRARAQGPDAAPVGEFAEGAAELEMDGLSRRRFMGVIGASAALASGGCVRKPAEKIVPFAQRPEDLIPGKPVYYATALQVGATVQGVLIESHDGRPTKIEGNPRHAGSQGGTDAWTQATILELYDPERSFVPYAKDAVSTWPAALEALRAVFDAAVAQRGKGLGIVVGYVRSPAYQDLLLRLKERHPELRLFSGDALAPVNAAAAAEAFAGKGAAYGYHLGFGAAGRKPGPAKGIARVLAADCDFLGTGDDHVRLSAEWARGRRLDGPEGEMSRLYAVEAHLTCTGMAADHRLRVRSGGVGEVLAALTAELHKSHGDKLFGGRAPDGAAAVFEAVANETLEGDAQAFVRATAKDLIENAGSVAILVGERQPPWVHMLGLFLNTALGSSGAAVRWIAEPATAPTEGLDALAAALEAGEITTLVCLGTNPAYEAPGELGMVAKLGGLDTLIHAGLYRDETGRLADHHVPLCHALEAWGDLRAPTGTISICQPLIAPLYDSHSEIELAGFLLDGNMVDGYSLVKGYWARELGGTVPEPRWRRWLHDGVTSGTPRLPRLPSGRPWEGVAKAIEEADDDAGGVEINFHVSPAVADGRFANNGWLQELPHPVTKLTWDNAAYLSAATAAGLGVEGGDMIEIEWEGRSLVAPAWIAPGQADDTVSLDLGYGRRELGSVATGAGVDVGALRSTQRPWFGGGATLRKAGGRHELACTQDHGTMDEGFREGRSRAIVRETSLDRFREDPAAATKGDLMRPEQLTSLFEPTGGTSRQQWGMSIDLNTCTGCSACVVACQAENNIPVVGKARVLEGREMHWIRIDRYYAGDDGNPQSVVQPMPCQHCENAPCETVCPVAATSHSPDGLNDMAYNRCIGTRYCANNCPYKVRRFNYFNFNLDIDLISRMQKNPDVTVRFRGVMEKCTYCVQRINAARIASKVAGEDMVADGAIETACAQACPTGAIVFGDIRDPKSAVARRKRQVRNYAVLGDLNNHPRTTYLARIRNPNPELGG